MIKKLFYLFNGIIAIATLITVALAIINSINPLSTYFRDKIPEQGYLSNSYENFVRQLNFAWGDR
tara:strand:- start:192 stop:386 length:195 start_codon:yes stop_codon:yes gene_type:complete